MKKFNVVNNSIIIIFLIIAYISNVSSLVDDHKTINNNNNKNSTNTKHLSELRKMEEVSACNQNINFNNEECDIVSPGPICSFNGEKIILPKKNPRGLVAYWTFDEIRVIDSTGNRNHAKNIVKPGPSMSGQGASGLFSNGDFVSVPYNESFNSKDYTITFWLFIIKDYFTQSEGVRYCPLIQRGNDDLFNKQYKRAPALYYDRVNKNLKVFISTKSDTETQREPQGEGVTSNAQINPQRWMHISIVKADSKVKLYINGILDNQFTLKQDTVMDIKDDFYIGGSPWLKNSCTYPFLIDEMRYYNIAVKEESIQAEASPALGGLDPAFIMLGGMNLDIQKAGTSCVDGYHICTSIELHTGGYQVARAMGWLDWNTHIWSHGALKTPSEFMGMKGLALCCLDLK